MKVLRNSFALVLAFHSEGKEIQDYFGQPNCTYAMRIKTYQIILKKAGILEREKKNTYKKNFLFTTIHFQFGK